ncbi:MAG: hypothetical protein C0618_08710 [Desulfuromonas sp.]|nr:MAG: hypothetical protein C0618_08710 [Desulfuromonas sp.]
MTAAGGLRVGHIPYLNCVPFFYHLKRSGFDGELVSGVPSALNDMLQQGRIDVSPSSSFEYARHWRDYLLLPNHSITSAGAVQSVLLFSPVPLHELENRQIAITGESATSINLMRVILREYVGLNNVTDAVPDGLIEDHISAGHPALLIGDRALQQRMRPSSGMICFDLGELWYRYTGLPFCFALWMVRKGALGTYRQQLLDLDAQLTQSRQTFLQTEQQVAADVASASGLNAAQKRDYWKRIDYGFDDNSRQGTALFFELCYKYQLLDERPEFMFLTD